MRVLGVMSHKEATATETVKGGWVGQHLSNTKIGGRQPQNKLMRLRTFKNLSNTKDNCTDIHSRKSQPLNSTDQIWVCLWQTSFWSKSIPIHKQKQTHTENDKRRRYASSGRKDSPTPT